MKKKYLFVVLIFMSLIVSASSISKPESKKLLKEFSKAQTAALKALQSKQHQSIKELKASLSKKEKDWKEKEKEVRHKFFEEHSAGPERRQYIQDFRQRQEAYLKSLAEEEAAKKRQNETELNSVKAEQEENLKKFKESLDKGETPSQDLWPPRN